MEAWTGWFYSGIPRVGQYIRVLSKHRDFPDIVKLWEGTVSEIIDGRYVLLDNEVPEYLCMYYAVSWKYRINKKEEEVEDVQCEFEDA